jgi:hypothetical protein
MGWVLPQGIPGRWACLKHVLPEKADLLFQAEEVKLDLIPAPFEMRHALFKLLGSLFHTPTALFAFPP